MACPKRRHSKMRSRTRRAANRLVFPQLARDAADGTTIRPHRVNAQSGVYRGRQVLDVST